jgi:ankyrin repeat protein
MTHKLLQLLVVSPFLAVCAIALLVPLQADAADSSEATSMLVSAIAAGNLSQASAAIEGGANVNADTGDGRTPLIVAAMFTKPEMVRLLLDHGADPRKRAHDPSTGNAVTAAFFAMNGTELTGRSDEPDARRHAAALEVLKLTAGRKEGLNLLVKRGPTELTALMIAAQAGALDAVEVLLAAGADPNATNGGKYTALDYAVDRPPVWSQVPAVNRSAIVRALLKAGARKDRKGADGLTPVARAARSGNAEISKLLAG